MADITATARGSANINTDRVVVDMAEKIALLKPRVWPLTILTKKLATKSTHNYRFDWLEDEYMARWTAVNNGGAAYDENTTEIVVDDSTIVAVGDLLKSVATGEIMKVTVVATGTHTLTVARGYGSTEAAATSVANDVKLLVIGNANIQGGGASAEKYNQTTTAFNYTQIFKTPFSVTNTLDAMKLYGGNELNRLRAKKAVEHGQSMEYAMWFGERKLDTTGDQPLTTTGGVLSFLSGVAKSGSAASSADDTTFQAALDAWIEDLFTDGSENKAWFCAPSIITRVNKLAKGKLEIVQGDNDTTYGLDIMMYRTPHGTLKMIHHPMFIQGYAGWSFALDMEYLGYRPLTGRDTKLMTNIQNNDEDGRRDMYITEAGIEVKLPKAHGIFRLT